MLLPILLRYTHFTRWRLLIVLLLFVLLPPVYLVFRPYIGPRAGIFIVVPVLAAAWLLGLRMGLIAWLIGLPVMTVTLNLAGIPGWDVLLRDGRPIPSLALLFVAYLVGRLREVSWKLEEELQRRAVTEQHLCQTQKMMARITDTIPDMVYICDLHKQRLDYVNSRVYALLGYTAAEMQHSAGLTDIMVDEPSRGTLWDNRIRRFGEDKQPEAVIEVEYRARHRSGEWRWFRSREVPFSYYPDGRPEQIIGIAQDITELKQQDEQIKKECQQATEQREAELSRVKTLFMTTVSHEFRTPLATIMSSSELLERYLERLTPARRDECLAVVRIQVHHMKQILDDLSLLIAIETKLVTFAPVTLDLIAFIRQTADRLNLNTFDLRFTFEGDLSAVQVDENLLRPTLNHVLTNAAQYSPPGSTIRCHAQHEANNIVITVTDQGIGIPEEDQSYIFDTFYRGRNVSHIGGTGLGLAIARRCLDLHGGTIHCESRSGEGTTFTIHLPAV
ncbi:MAG: PAS domain-containing sensor histidine kinase [Anaerolineae bacterium]|nr:PAS domain-containing sensor histidine kinase [Anaerolineae bacterium]